jgi:peptidoglycan-N-acetylglucosamine deacetylase
MPRVTLSFDNGPHPDVTPVVLACLARHGIRSTFFVVGRNVASAGGHALMAEAHARGHWIGNHTFNHATPLGRVKDAAKAIAEIERTSDLIGDFAHPSRFFRPFGEGGNLDDRLLSDSVVNHLCDRRYSCVVWNAIPRDWDDPDGWDGTALHQISRQDESLVVLHDIAGRAMDHLDQFIAYAIDSGVTFRQDFPESCVLIREGKRTQPFDQLVARD